MKKIIALLLAAVICLSLVACNKTPEENKDESATKAPVVQTTGDVKLTKDNFETYFEFIEESFFTKDSSGEYTQFRTRHYYKLKDEFRIDSSKSSIELKYNYSSSTKKVNLDFDNQKYTFGDQVGEKKEYNNIPVNQISQITYKEYAILLFQPYYASKGDTEVTYFSDFEIASVEGTIHLLEPVVEHEHPTENHTH